MKKLFSASLAALALAFTLTSCNCYTKMMKHTNAGIVTTTTPEVLTLKGDFVAGDLEVVIPEKAFHKYGVLKVTPVLVSLIDGTRAAGTPHFLQGEKVTDNYQVISYSNGGKYTQKIEIPYTPSMRLAELVLSVEAKCLKSGNKIKNFTDYETEIPVAMATNTMQAMADNYAKVAIAPDAYQRVTIISEDANLMYTINSSVVRKSALNSDDIAALEQFIVENTGDPKKAVGAVQTKSYASPDGPLGLNDKLSQERGKTTEKAVAARFEKNNVQTQGFEIDPMGEDWEGFRELVAASDIEDRDLILQVLSMYSDPQVRDREIKNMTAAFDVLAKKILPELRRSKMQVDVAVSGLTDQEMIDIVNSGKVSTLKLEEMLYAAGNLFSDNTTKATIYLAAANKFNDFRAWNNLGVVAAWEGEYESADEMFKKAASINNTNPQVVNNLGVIALSQGKKDEAAKYFAASSTPEAKYNMGLVELANGNYSASISKLEGYNKGLAQYLNGDISSAKSTLKGVDTWRANYLMAVISANQGNGNDMISYLEKAMEQNPTEVEALAATEVNFIEYFSNSDFAEMVDVEVEL